LKSFNGGGEIEWSNFQRAFKGCENMVLTVDNCPDLSKEERLSQMFSGAKSIDTDLDDWDVSNAEVLFATFANTNAFNGDISS
jgi:hypothetical protein